MNAHSSFVIRSSFSHLKLLSYASLPIQQLPIANTSVSFSPTSEMCLVSRHDNKSDLFYSALELQIIKLRSMHDSYNLLECNIIGNDIVDMLKNIADTSAFLGLEHCLSKSTYIERTQKRRASIEAAISEHHRQLSSGVNDPTPLQISLLPNQPGHESERGLLVSFILRRRQDSEE